MRKFKIILVLMFGLLLFNVSAQTLTSDGNHTIKGKWTFENDITVKGTKYFLTDGLKSFRIKNDFLNSGLQIGISEKNGEFLPGNKPGDITIRRHGGPSKRLIITNSQTLNHPNNVDAVTGIMGAITGGGVWVHNNGFVRIGNYKEEMPEEQLEVEGNISFGYGKGRSIIWESSKSSNGFGHKIYNSDPGYRTLLNIAGRHNSKSWTDIIKITSNGLVGIGVEGVPTLPLQVEGEGRFITTSEGVNYLVRVGGNTHLKGNAFGISFDPEGYKDGYVKRSKIAIVAEGDDSGWSRGKLHILQKNSKDNDPATLEDAVFTIDQNGKVGVGTTSPNTKLDVNGTIRANEIKVTKAPGADFVFDADYSLRTLDEVEDFINKNNHLPEIPSAKDMETNGVELTKMNQLLLMKIEELTLYLIEQKKEIKELNALVNTFVSESK